LEIRSRGSRGDVPKFRNWVSGAQATPTLGSFYCPHAVGVRLHLCTKFAADSSFPSKVIKGSQNLEITSRNPGHAQFIIRMLGGSVLYVCTTFEVGSSIHPKVISRSQNFEIWSRDLGHAHLGSFYSPHAGGIRLDLCTKN